ncbi:MAG TPA: pirin family protein [Anaeromyxobacteraceae bacterium]|nr:pirin family protein [Anaeromyxobacteraceae bacterium]
MFTLRRAEERGLAERGWLRSRHSFSFADYYDPAHMGFHALRVINEDLVQPASGFGPHPHRDMEIVTYVLEGELAHRDSLGSGSTIRPGEVQRMSAGKGVVHSEANPSKVTPVHFLQIWIRPDTEGVSPSYEQKAFALRDQEGKLVLVASPDGAEGSLTLKQDARLRAGFLGKAERVRYLPGEGRSTYLHLARGELDVNGTRLRAGDALMAEGGEPLLIEGRGNEGGEVLVFDLA